MFKSNRHEHEFLPAALEVLESPPTPLGRIIIWSLMAFFTIAVIWTYLGEVDIVAAAQGKIISNGRGKVIQPLEHGVVRAIHVEEGQRVKKDEILIELDPTSNSADVHQLRNHLTVTRLEALRLTKLVEGITIGGIDKTEIDFNEIQRATGQEIQTQIQVFDAQRREYESQLAAIDKSTAEKRAEFTSTRSLVTKLEATLPIVTRRAQALKKLLDKNLASNHDYLTIEQERLEQKHDLDAYYNRLAEITAAIDTLKQEKHVFYADFKSRLVLELAQTQKTIASLRQELIKAEQKAQLQQLKSPVDGKVQQLSIYTIGGVVTPAQSLMVVVPDNQELRAEVFLHNKDIGFVEEGQLAEVKIDTFQFTKYGLIDGEIINISSDAIEDERLGLVYAAQVSLTQSVMHVGERVVNLSPGMSITAEIKTGQRRLIEYFLSPLMEYQSESIRER